MEGLRKRRISHPCSRQIDGAHVQPTEVGFVVQAEAFRPAADGRRMCSVCLTSTDFSPFVGHFSPSWAKNALQKKESTMLPQAIIAFA